MQWSDQAFVLSARKHGESSVIVQLLTREHGRHAGLVRGGAGRRARGIYQPGNRVQAQWRARLHEHLGTFSCELTAGNVAALLGDGDRLAALSAACAVAAAALPERQPHASVFESFADLIEALATAGAATRETRPPPWAAAYVRWELDLLRELGYGLDLGACAATGANDNLAYVSPKSGRAVSLSAGEPYRDRLLPLPAFLLGPSVPDGAAVADGLRLTGYFLARHVFAPQNRGLPPARRRLADRLEGAAGAP